MKKNNLRYTGDLVLQGISEENIGMLKNITSENCVVNLESPFVLIEHKKIKDKVCLHSDSETVSILKEVSPYLVNLSNNHINDFGLESAKFTMDHLIVSGLSIFGCGVDGDTNHIVIDSGRKVINVAYTDRSADLTGNKLHCDSFFYGPKPVNYAELIELREKYPDYVIIVSVHWGLEDIDLPTPDVREIAKKIAKTDVDVIIGHHPHIIQPWEMIDNTHVYYSLGNLYFPEIKYDLGGQEITKKQLPHQMRGLIVDITYTNRDDLKVETCKAINQGEYLSLESYILPRLNKKMHSFEYKIKSAIRLINIYRDGFFTKVSKKIKSLILNVMATRLKDEHFIKIVFYKALGYPLNLNTPRTLNEKLQWSKLNLVNEKLTMCADKLAVREYISEKIGDEYLVPVVKEVLDIDSLTIDDLPEFPFIIKANHTSGTYKIVWNRHNIDIENLKSECRKWLLLDYTKYNKEYQYKSIERKIFIEKLLIDENGKIPSDIKFSCIHGNVEIIHVDSNKEKTHLRNNYSREWLPLDFDWPSDIPKGAIIEKPKNLEKLVYLAEEIAAEFPFVRVDFYTLNNKIYFGEVTFHPTSGMGQFSDYKYDLYYGDKLNFKAGLSV
ncbi:ATP-grasp fold amidoligase family protein [Vibrio chagasii]|uniref:ATP-grasp fold amidoligase family protein n=1 Tax=Vibrio chagasii TaxID=170679 RepID=UPI0038CD54A5